jgi:IS5 family transposase
MCKIMTKNTPKQTDFLVPNIVDLVKSDHPYRRLLELVDFAGLVRPYCKQVSRLGRPGYDMQAIIKALILQWMEDLSDRELERFLQENLAAKVFCGFELMDKTPDHTRFCGVRGLLGTKNLVKLFNKLGDKMREKNVISDVFTFVDASHLISKSSLWEERDKAIAAGEEKLNNSNVRKYAADNDADYGCKGVNKFWYGYKRHVAVDAKQGMIVKVAATPASTPDARGLKHICPKQGMVLADKGYCGKEAQMTIRKNGCHSGAIKKNNMIGKNHKKDGFLSKLRMPFEGVFSKMNKRLRYKGLEKVQFQVTMQALVHNLKRLIALKEPPILLFS